jgi:hypothetical protein
MSSTECSACGAKVKDTQICCPKCNKLNPNFKTKDRQSFEMLLNQPEIKYEYTTGFKVGCAISIMVMVIALILLVKSCEHDKPAEQSVSRPVSRQEVKPPPVLTEKEKRQAMRTIEISAYRLYSDYEANAVAADDEYRDKNLIVDGEVQTIGLTIDGKPFVGLRAGGEYKTVLCYGSSYSKQKFAALQKGVNIEVVGYAGPLIVDSPTLYDCGILGVKPKRAR